MQNNNGLINYNECQMTKLQHNLAYVVASILAVAVLMLFYHNIVISLIAGLIIAVFLEKFYAKYTIVQRKKQLRLQFKTFLESMTVAVRAGQNELISLKTALNDLKLTYNRTNDIIREVEFIIKSYENAGIPLSVLFVNFGNRSGIEDIRTFGTIFEVISGKSTNFGMVITQSQQIISDKIEIETEIETSIAAVKSELSIMFIMPIIMVIMMSAMGGDMMSALFTTPMGWAVSTIAIIIFVVAFFLAQKITNIKL